MMLLLRNNYPRVLLFGFHFINFLKQLFSHILDAFDPVYVHSTPVFVTGAYGYSVLMEQGLFANNCPTYIYGDDELLRMIVLRAICRSARDNNKKVLSTNALDLSSEFRLAVDRGGLTELYDKYLDADLIAIDDIQLIDRDELSTWICKMITKASEKHIHVVLSSDCSLGQLIDLRESIKDRMGQGLVLNLNQYSIRILPNEG